MSDNSLSDKRRASFHLWCFFLFLGREILVGNNDGPGKTCLIVNAARAQFVPSRDRIVTSRQKNGKYRSFRDNGRPIEGPNYRRIILNSIETTFDKRNEPNKDSSRSLNAESSVYHNEIQKITQVHRRAGQFTSCCSKYLNYSASDLCSLYNQDCTSGKTKSHDDGNSYCTQQGLAFIGLSFSVQTKKGNPNSYQLCDQFPMENLIDRDYKYVMSMDEDGWLVGGGYKQFDYSGKMPYIDSSHTELLRIGSMDVSKGGTSIQQVYKAMSSISFEPFPIYPEYLKGGGGHKHEKEREKEGSKDREGSRDKEDNKGKDGEGKEGKNEHRGRERKLKENGNSDSTPSGDITLIVSVVEVYSGNSAYSTYQTFINELFKALENVNQGSCVDDHDTDPHVSMARGVKFKSSYHMQQYMNAANLEVAVWQAMYPKGVVIGSDSYASFPLDGKGKKNLVGYGNLYFFFDRMNITKAFPPSRTLSNEESYYATLYQKGKASEFYKTVTSGNYNNEDGGDSWEYNPYYQWKTNMAIHDQTNGWDLPPNCNEEGETFVGIPLSRKSKSNLQSTITFQKQFDFEYLLDRNFTYILGHGTNHGWLVGGEETGNGAGSLVDKDTAHIPVFYLGTTNPKMGGMSLSDMIKVLKTVQFGTLYIKPAFVFADSNGHLKLQFEADPYSSMGYLYDNLCQMLGVKWNNISSYNSLGLYTSCAMHAAGDRASYGCGPSNANSGGFCPQMTIAYSPRFKSQDAAASYITAANNYVDYWRSLYPYGVAVGTDTFCKSKSSSGYQGGCLGLFLNRMDLYYVLAPDLSGAWVEFNGNSIAPTHSPAPTFSGGCDDPRNFHLDKCFRIKYSKQYAPEGSGWWSSLGTVGQLTLITVFLLSTVFIVALFIAQSRKQKRRALKKFFSSRKRKKRGDKALLAMEERYDIKGNYRQRSRSSRRSNSSRFQKGKQRFLCAALDLGTEDDAYDGINSTVYEPPKIQVIADVASNVLPNSNIDSSNFPKGAEPAHKTRAITSEIDLNGTSPQESILSGSARFPHAHATASSIDFKKSPSHLSKTSRMSRMTAKPISFHQWLVKELKPSDESATEANAAFLSTATSGISDASVDATSSAARRLIREKASSALSYIKSMGNNAFSNSEPPQSVSSFSSVVGRRTEETKQPTRLPMTAENEPVINTDYVGKSMGNNAFLNSQPPQSVSSFSSVVGGCTEETKQPTRPPMTAKIEPVINTDSIGMQKSATTADADVIRNSSQVSNLAASSVVSSRGGKAPNALAYVKLIASSVVVEPKDPKRTPSSLSKESEVHLAESNIQKIEIELGTTTSVGSNHPQHSIGTADVDLTRTSSHVSKISSLNSIISGKGKSLNALAFLKSLKNTNDSSSGIVESKQPYSPTDPAEFQEQVCIPDLYTGCNGPQHTTNLGDVDLTRTSSHVSKVSRSTARSSTRRDSNSFTSLKLPNSTHKSTSAVEISNKPPYTNPEIESASVKGSSGLQRSIAKMSRSTTRSSTRRDSNSFTSLKLPNSTLNSRSCLEESNQLSYTNPEIDSASVTGSNGPQQSKAVADVDLRRTSSYLSNITRSTMTSSTAEAPNTSAFLGVLDYACGDVKMNEESDSDSEGSEIGTIRSSRHCPTEVNKSLTSPQNL